MAQVKISNLPQVTEYTYLDILPVVDSGSTTTSKIDIKSLYRASGSTITGTIGQNNIILGSSNSTINDTATGGGTGDNAILASTNVTIEKNQGADAAIIASSEVRISNDSGEGAMNAIIASYNNTTEIEGGFANAIMASSGGAKITRGERNAVIGGYGTDIQYGGNQVAIASNGWNLNGSYNLLVAASESGSIYNHRYTAVIGNYQFGESDGGNQCLVAAGENNRLESRGSFASWKSMISVKESTCQDEGASMIATSGRSSNYTWTLHTDNIHTYKTETFDVINSGNVGGSINVDCSLGTIFSFTLTADTTPNFVNVRDGQRFIFIVYNNGSWTVPTATVGGTASTVYAKNGSINPTNNGYTKYTATYDGTYMFLDEELGFAAV